MEELSLFDSELRLMDIIWDEAPVESGKLVKIAKEKFQWSKSTTYTVIHKLVVKGFVVNDSSIVKVLIPKERIQIQESNKIVEERFAGSLPSFLASFLGKKSLTDEEGDELIDLIKQHMEDKK
ncbi:MAG: BlaI/MecI/CopY family transcriptional regulator [Clostridia bacterium]|nr:BlaI/MecI/CopY family transcriptional regulator [Clostridia bacterium]